MIIARQMKRAPHLVVDDRQTIESIQNDFNRLYPFLKLGFFKTPGTKGKGNAKSNMYLSNEKLEFIQKVKKNGLYHLPVNTTVAEIERIFESDFGLYVQVFRKSGNVWLETSATDDWTLEQQNEEGKSLAQHYQIERESAEDHDIY